MIMLMILTRCIVVFPSSNISTHSSLQASFIQGRSDAQPAIVVFSPYNSYYDYLLID